VLAMISRHDLIDFWIGRSAQPVQFAPRPAPGQGLPAAPTLVALRIDHAITHPSTANIRRNIRTLWPTQ